MPEAARGNIQSLRRTATGIWLLNVPALSSWIERQWYSPASYFRYLFPLAWPFRLVSTVRRGLYSAGFMAADGPDCPVVVVGNLTVGGTGKTPLVIWLAEFLARNGWQPGIISRGYGGMAAAWPQSVEPDSDPRLVGDEAVLISRRTDCPVEVGPNRVHSSRKLQQTGRCDIIISDDGLQHYALRRELEIVVVDSARKFGNGLCLPVGPLRESVSRLRTADLLVYNGESEAGGFGMKLVGDRAVNNLHPSLKMPLSQLAGSICHGVAGIGNPGRFFDHLVSWGLRPKVHRFPDHHRFVETDLCFNDEAPVLMTEKDAVKCFGFARDHHWHVPVEAQLDCGFGTQLLKILKGRLHE